MYDPVHEKIVEVVRIADKLSDDYEIEELPGNPTVAECNDSPPGEPVVIAHYNDRGRKEYAFPLSRLEVPNNED